MNKQTISSTTLNVFAQIRVAIPKESRAQFFKTVFMLLLLTGPTLIFGQDLDSGIEAIEETADSISGFFDPIETVVVRLVTL